MMTTRRAVILGAAGAMLVSALSQAMAADPIRVGELNSYSRIAAFTVPYRMGWQLAEKEINEAGGIAGQPLEIVSRDDNGTPADAVRVAEELVTRENVAFLFGTFLSNVGLAVSDFAKQRQVLFIAAEPLSDALTLEAGNRFTYRVRPSTYMQTRMLVEEAKGLEAKRWAIVVPNYEYGQAAAAAFKELLAEQVPDAEIVAEQYPALGQIDAGATVAALEQAQPDAIFNALFAGDLAKFVREGTVRGLFEDREVLSLLSGEPEYLDPLGDEVPEGWIVTGYPWSKIETAEHRKFLEAYEGAYGEHPRMGSLLGYSMPYVIKAMIEKAGSTETEAMIAALEEVEVSTPAGPMRFRDVDNQSTLGTWVGKLALEDGKGTMTDWHYADGEDYLIPREQVLEVRKD
jgi:branched-chain amino acid transport system substrate-binding protein